MTHKPKVAFVCVHKKSLHWKINCWMRRYKIIIKEEKNTGINFFQRYLTVWVFLCMIVGVLLGHFAPALPAFSNKFEYARISIPMAVLIWVMIYPMMLKVDFRSIQNVGKNPKGLFVTWIINWLIKPFTMYGFAFLFYPIHVIIM